MARQRRRGERRKVVRCSVKSTAAAMDEEQVQTLRSLLDSWGLSSVVNACIEQRFTVEVLLELDESSVSAVTEFKGEQLLLLKRIKEYKLADTSQGHRQQNVAASQSSSRAQSTSSTILPCSSSSFPSTSSTSKSSALLLGKRPAETSTTASKRIALITDAQKIENLDLLSILLGETDSKTIYESYQQLCQHTCEDDTCDHEICGATVALSSNQRDVLVAIIVDHILNLLGHTPSHQLLSVVAQKIVEVFPTECLETYYIAPKALGKHQTHAKGKLSNRLRNEPARVKNINRSGALQQPSVSTASKQVSKSGNLQSIVKKGITTEVKEACRWLESSRSPWPEVLNKWLAAAPFRFKDLFYSEGKHFINDYIEKWSILSHQSGYELLLQDFKILFPKAKSLFLRFPLFEKRTIDIARRDIKDKFSLGVLRHYKSDLHEDSRVSILLSILPAIRPAHTIPCPGVIPEKVKKISISVSRDSYLLYVTAANDVRKSIRDRRGQLKGEDGGGQPLIVIVGGETQVRSVYVSVANELYQCDSVLQALDIFFKTFHALHTAYPTESAHIWLMMQRGVYGFETEWDDLDILPHSWIKIYE